MKQIIKLIVLLAALLLAGCPDYSHLRPVPDYQNMTDSATESE